MDRRKFLQTSAAMVALGTIGQVGNAFGWAPPRTKVVKRRLGKTGFEVFPVVYGGMVSMNDGQDASHNYVPWAIDRGANYFDVAPNYGDAEVVMGNALRPYRKNVYLACKSRQRFRKQAEAEFERSLQRLHTDHFDVYQIHELSTMKDVDEAFGPDGIMEMMVKAKQDGSVRKLGFSAHSEEAALKAMSLYEFDTVMFPVNWQLNKLRGQGTEVCREAKKQDMGILAIKPFVHRGWKGREEKESSTYPGKAWYKPMDTDDREFAIATLRYALDMGVDVLVPPGNFRSFSFCIDNIEEVLGKPLSAYEKKLLDKEFEKVKDIPFL